MFKMKKFRVYYSILLETFSDVEAYNEGAAYDIIANKYKEELFEGVDIDMGDLEIGVIREVKNG